MKRPRLAVVVSHPIQNFCPQYQSWSRQEDWEVKVIFGTSNGRESYFDKEFGRDIRWDDIELPFDHVILSRPTREDSGADADTLRVDECLDEYCPDLVIVYGYAQPLPNRARRWAVRNAKRVIMVSDSEKRHHRPAYRRALKKALLPRIYRRIDAFMTVGDANEEYLRHYGVPAERMIRTPFPVNPRLYSMAASDAIELAQGWRDQVGIPRSAVVLSTVGKLILRKRQKDLIAAHKILRARGHEVYTVIVGSGSESEYLRSIAGDGLNHGVIFTGFLQPSVLPAVYAATDIYVHPAEVEPHALAISEAIFMGKPAVISSRCGSFGPTDDVRPGCNGIVYPCGMEETLAAELERLVINRQLRHAFSEASMTIGQQNQQRSHVDGLRDALRAVRLLDR